MLIKLGLNQIEFSGKGSIITLADGSVIPGCPEDTDSYRATASRLGYGTDTLRLCKEHELMHLALTHWLGLNESPTLQYIATGKYKDETHLRECEEDAILAIQKYINAANVNLIELLSKKGT